MRRRINWKFICNNKGFADIIIALVAGLAAGGIAEGISALSSSPKTPGLPATPSLDSASTTAQADQTAQRRALLAAGGNTNITNGTGIVLGSDVNSVSLVGSS